MKKMHLLRAMTALTLGASMVMSMAACKASNKNKDDDKKDKEPDQTTEVTESDDKSSDEKQPMTNSKVTYADDASFTQLSANAPASYDPLTVDDIHDTWVNENGTYMYFNSEANELIDYLGTRYMVMGVYDDGVILANGFSYIGTNEIYEYSPLPSTFFMPMYLQGDELIVGNQHLYRASSAKGQEFANAIKEEISDLELNSSYFLDFKSTPITFNGHGIVDDHPQDSFFYGQYWEYENGIIRIFDDSDYYEDYLTIYKLSEDSYIVGHDYGPAVFLSKNVDDGAKMLDGEYVFYAQESDSVYFATINNLEGTVTDFDSNPVDEWNFTIEASDDPFDDHYIDTPQGYGGLRGHVEGMIGDLYDDKITMLPVDTFFGQMIIYYEDVIHGKIENIFMKDTYTSTRDGITAEVQILDWDCAWGTDVPGVFFSEDSFTEGIMPMFGPAVDLYYCDYPVLITYTAPKSYFDSIDSVYVLNDYGGYFTGKTMYSDDYTVTEDGDNYIITIETYYDDHSSFVLSSTNESTDRDTLRDCYTILNQPVLGSLWGSMCSTGDILKLVDLDYLADSIVNDDGAAVFWVSTPEQLATATYYINEMDLLLDSYDTYYYIHLMNDIDLSEYTWAPIGVDEFVHDSYIYRDVWADHYMTGIFFGNGYSIKNVYMDPNENGSAFFGYCKDTTVIGLTIDNPTPNGYIDSNYQYVSGYTSYAFTEPWSNDCEFIDCKVIIDPAFTECDPFPSYDYIRSYYKDCVVYNRDASTGELKEVERESGVGEFYELCSQRNWVEEYYNDGNGNYVYDAAGEFEDYKQNPSGFINGSYYFDDGSDTPVKTLIYTYSGYMYNGDFLTNYGCIPSSETVEELYEWVEMISNYDDENEDEYEDDG